MQDFRQEGPPADIGTFQLARTAIVFQFTFSGTTYVVSMGAGVSGWVLIDQGVVASTVIQAALAYLDGLDGGDLEIREGNYLITVQLTLIDNLLLTGSWATILTVDAGITVINPFLGTSKTGIIIEKLKFVGHVNLDHFIFFSGCDDCIVDRCYFDTVKKEAVTFASTGAHDSERFICSSNIGWRFALDATGAQGFVQVDAITCVITDNILDADTQGGQAYAGYLRGTDIVFANNTIKNGAGLVLVANPVEVTTSERIIISENIAQNLTSIDTNHAVVTENSTLQVKIISNTIEDYGARGISLEGSDHEVIDNKLKDGTNNAIYVLSADTEVSLNKIENSVEHAIWIRADWATVVGNKVKNTGVDPNARVAFLTDSEYGVYSSNEAYDNRGTKWQSYGLEERDGADNNLIIGNIFPAALHRTGAMLLFATSTSRAMHNIDYNPVGRIANPYTAGAGNIIDAGQAQAHPTTNVTYTIVHSPKLITIYGGTVSTIVVDGIGTGLETSWATADKASVYLNPGQTFRVVWTVQPTSQVYGG